MNIKHLKDNFGSFRIITTLVPDTFLRKIIVISTLGRTEDGKSQTAISQTRSLNAGTVDYSKLEWKILKEHKTITEAIAYHTELVNSKTFSDCEEDS